MDDLISRQAAIDALRDAENHAFNSFYKGLAKAHKIITDLPSTIDAVPVVRCKDCVYWASGANEDDSWEYCYWFDREIDGNEFCSYGERKDGADNGEP